MVERQELERGQDILGAPEQEQGIHARQLGLAVEQAMGKAPEIHLERCQCSGGVAIPAQEHQSPVENLDFIGRRRWRCLNGRRGRRGCDGRQRYVGV